MALARSWALWGVSESALYRLLAAADGTRGRVADEQNYEQRLLLIVQHIGEIRRCSEEAFSSSDVCLRVLGDPTGPREGSFPSFGSHRSG